jgi:hypothetical protein
MATSDPAGSRPRLDRRPEAITYSVEDLILAVQDGAVRVPPFQRGMRWDDGDRLTLFDSILRGFPIGTLLFWRHHAPEEWVELGEYRVQAAERSDARYVFDGQQRITTLVQAATMDAAPGARVLYYNLVDACFAWERVSKSGDAPPPSLVPVRALLDTATLTDWIVENAVALTPAHRADAIDAGKRLREYRVPAYVVDAADPATLRVIFERVNRSGRRLTDAEVFHALYVVGERKAEGLASVQRAGVDLAWGEIDEDLALNVVRAVGGVPVRTALRADLDGERMQQAVRRSRVALHAAAGFLQSDGHLPHAKFAPYVLPIITLARFFDAFPAPSSRALTLLRRWLWRGLGGLHLTGSTVHLRQHLSTIIHGEEHESVQRLLSLAPGRADDSVFTLHAPDFGTARTRVQICALAARVPRDLTTGAAVDLAQVAMQDGPPTVRLVDDAAPSLAGHMLHPRLPRSELVRLLARADAATLDSHFVDAAALVALTGGDEATFVERRGRAVTGWLRTFVARMAEWGADDSPPLAALAGEDDD